MAACVFVPRRQVIARRQSRCGCSLAVLLVVALASGNRAAAQAPQRRAAEPPAATAVSPQLAATLTAPFSSAVVSRPLRESMGQIAAVGQINLWIDRRVDPGLPVSIAAGSKTVFQAIAQAAQSVGLEAAAAGNVVLVGRREWVTAVAGSILALPPELSQSTAAAPIQWPELTTPREAIKIVAGAAGADTLALPHDLWPAVSWRGVSPQLAILLITAQFDLLPIDPVNPVDLAPVDRFEELAFAAEPAAQQDQPASSLEPTGEPQSARQLPEGVETFGDEGGRVGAEQPSMAPATRPVGAAKLQPLQAPDSLELAYPNGPHVPQMRQAAMAADPQSRFRTGRAGAPLELTASPDAHVAAAAAYFSHPSARVAQGVDLDRTRFSLRLRDAPAQDVFAQLAATAGRRLEIAEAAAERTAVRVTFEVQEVTLTELAQHVADQIGVAAIWTEEQLRIGLPERGTADER